MTDHNLGIDASILMLDLVGTFVFALSGGIAGVRHRLDLFGVLVLAFATATTGGILRDLMIGAVPPEAFTDWRYLLVSMLAGLTAFYGHGRLSRIHNPVMVFDAAGLAVFAVAGTYKALEFGLYPFAAVLLGALTAVGGGMARDLLVGETPRVLRSELYAVAALVGSTLVVIGELASLPAIFVAVGGGSTALALRLAAVSRGWRPPSAQGLADLPGPDSSDNRRPDSLR